MSSGSDAPTPDASPDAGAMTEVDAARDTGSDSTTSDASLDTGATPVDSSAPTDAGADHSTPPTEGGQPEGGLEGGTEGGLDAAAEASDGAVLPDASDSGAACLDDLSNTGTADFTVAFSLSTTQTNANVAVINQRSACTNSLLWDVRMSSGYLYIATDDSSGDYNNLTSAATVNDGNVHAIVVKRVSEVLSVTIDGTPSGSGPSTAAFGALPALEEGTDVCQSTDGTVALVGSLTNVCVSSSPKDAGGAG